jgi:hypothetical protein
VKRIFRYLKGIEEFGLWYPKGKDLSLIAYTDADWVGCIHDQRRTSETSLYLDIKFEYNEPIPIYCDNTSAIIISRNPMMDSKMKNIPIKYQFLQE